MTDGDIKVAESLGQFALRDADDPEMFRKASSCPWVDDVRLKKLFGGRPYGMQVFGEKSCMATDKRRTLMISVSELSSGISVERLRSEGCDSHKLLEIGKNGVLSFSCKGGNPRASIDFEMNGLEISMAWWSKEEEPGDTEKAALVEAAKFAAASKAAQ